MYVCSLDEHDDSLAPYLERAAIQCLQDSAHLFCVRSTMSCGPFWLGGGAAQIPLQGSLEIARHDLAIPHGERSVTSFPLQPCRLEVPVGVLSR